MEVSETGIDDRTHDEEYYLCDKQGLEAKGDEVDADAEYYGYYALCMRERRDGLGVQAGPVRLSAVTANNP